MSKEVSPWGMVVVALLGASAWGCDDGLHEERSIGKQVHEDFAEGSGGPPHAAWHAGGLERAFVASTAEGRWAVVDAWSGQVWSTVKAGHDAFLHDAVLDPWSGRLLTFEAYEDEWGEVAAYGVGPGSLGERAVLGWLEGDARLWPTPHGPLTFELSQGARWRLMPAEGGFAPSRLAALPRSVWAWQDGEAVWIEALTYGTAGYAPQLEVALGGVDQQGLSPVSAAPLPVPPGSETSARMVPASWTGGAVLADLGGSGLHVMSLPWCAVDAGCPADAAWTLPIDGERLEQMIAVPELEAVALLTSSPSQLVAVQLPSGGGEPSFAVLPLSGQVRPEARFFSRDLLLRGSDRLLAATDQGLAAVDLSQDGAGLLLQLDASFDGGGLRGPLAGFPPSGF